LRRQTDSLSSTCPASLAVQRRSGFERPFQSASFRPKRYSRAADRFGGE
jgi:hypothetical protein